MKMTLSLSSKQREVSFYNGYAVKIRSNLGSMNQVVLNQQISVRKNLLDFGSYMSFNIQHEWITFIPSFIKSCPPLYIFRKAAAKSLCRMRCPDSRPVHLACGSGPRVARRLSQVCRVSSVPRRDLYLLRSGRQDVL